jgi:hypothetical protein
VALEYRVTELPPVWPGKRTISPKRAPFKTQWAKTLHVLERELKHLRARKVEMALDIRMGDLRQDGMLRADARPKPAVIVSFIDGDGQRQAYPCDTFAWWQDNLYAIAVVLEDLRRAERYGVQPALLRAGFKALPSATTPTLSTAVAADIIAKHSDSAAFGVEQNADIAKSAVRAAIFRTHPDRNSGDRTAYDRVEAARKTLSAHHGVSL